MLIYIILNYYNTILNFSLYHYFINQKSLTTNLILDFPYTGTKTTLWEAKKRKKNYDGKLICCWDINFL